VSAFIDHQRGRFAVELICRTLGVSTSSYYQRTTGVRSARMVADERLTGRIVELHAANYHAYGARRMWKALGREGERVGRDRVARLMRRAGIQGAKRRGKPWRTTTPDPEAARRPDLVQRNFTAERPNALWVADLTYLRCWEGLVFFAFVIDVFSRRVVGWQFASHMRTDLVLDALRMALHQSGPGADVQLIHHSDRGSQYTSIDFTQELTDHGGPRERRVGRRRLRQRAGRELRRLLQVRADRRPRLARPRPTRARDRRVGRLVQHHPPAPIARRHPTRRIRGPPRPRRGRAALALRARSARPRHDPYDHDPHPANQLTRPPSNPGRLRTRHRRDLVFGLGAHQMCRGSVVEAL